MGCLKLYQEREGLEKSSVFFRETLGEKRGQQIFCLNYYPFGLTFNSYTRSTSTPNKYKFGGKEEQEEWGVIDFGARMYMADIGRWGVIDPLSERYITGSPYAFVMNNPLRNQEIDGRYFDEKNEKKAARIEKKIGKKAAKLGKKARKLAAKGKDVSNVTERLEELENSTQDVQEMRSDQNTEYRYAKVGGKEFKDLGLVGPTTTSTGTNSRGDNVTTMFTESKMDSKLHEGRHGGDLARGTLQYNTTGGYGVSHEISAYRAGFAWSGKLSFRDSPSSQVMMQRIMAGQDPTIVNIMSIHQIKAAAINSMVDPGFIPIYPPRDANGNLLIPLNIWNNN